MIRILISLILAAGVARADGERPGAFDYYVLSLSWSPNWCALQGDERAADQCDTRHDFGWVLHGLWPQQEKGWPTFCRANERAPTPTMTNAMTDIMGSSGLAWYQWKKHGTCSGLSSDNYYALSRAAYAKVQRPEILRKLTRAISLPAKVIESAFLEANLTLSADQITITCTQNLIQEARICLTRNLAFRRCGVDALRDCTLTKATLYPVR
jgi:ribonuclease T2